MSSLDPAQVPGFDSLFGNSVNDRRAAQDDESKVFTAICLKESITAVCRCEISTTLKNSVDTLLKSNLTAQESLSAKSQSPFSLIGKSSDMVQFKLSLAESPL